MPTPEGLPTKEEVFRTVIRNYWWLLLLPAAPLCCWLWITVQSL